MLQNFVSIVIVLTQPQCIPTLNPTPEATIPTVRVKCPRNSFSSSVCFTLQIPMFYLLQRNSNLAQIDLYNILYTFKDSSYLTLQYILGDSLNQGFNIT